MYLLDLSMVNLLSVFCFGAKNFKFIYPNYPTHRLYFGEVETPYWVYRKKFQSKNVLQKK